MSNRAAITSRFNLEQQRELRDLMVFYKKDAKAVMQIAFALLVESTKKVKEQMAEREAATKEVVPSVETE